MSRRPPPRALLIAASAASVAAGTAMAAVASHPVRRHDPGLANLLFLLALCAGTLLLNSALSRAIEHYWSTRNR
ncbi:hypothetical protein [Kitasatospora sp. NPDC093806]|uniref:hypothetical protein n=1 Tax=Kitasatospora sp. NPDC093806 TaxID=3155075 RepID=UPI0034443035